MSCLLLLSFNGPSVPSPVPVILLHPVDDPDGLQTLKPVWPLLLLLPVQVLLHWSQTVADRPAHASVIV